MAHPRRPLVLLHDHLDGGLRPTTIIELADQQGHQLPTTDPLELGDWFRRGANRRDLGLYLETFVHTFGVMQTPEAVERVAYEAVADLAADGVIHAELRYAPELSVGDAMNMDDVVEAMTAGLARGSRDHGCTSRAILAALRNGPHSLATAEAAVRWSDAGVVGFDLAGPEDDYPVEDHVEACRAAANGGIGITLHAGEAHGPNSIAQALDPGGAMRIGHGVRIVEDQQDGVWGPIATAVLERGVPLELCPTSNLHTGVVDDLADHPIDRLRRAGFRVTVNTDNRLMSGVSASGEVQTAARLFGWDASVIADVQRTAADVAFLDDTARRELHARLDAAYGTRPTS